MLREGWRQLGLLGRTALVGVFVSAVIAIALGIAIPQIVEGYMLRARTRAVVHVLEQLEANGLIPVTEVRSAGELDAAVMTLLMGGETHRVKVWSPEGKVLYSDAGDLIGQTFPLSDDLLGALSGETRVGEPSLERPENQFERDLQPMLEFYLPVRGPDGDVVNVFEVYQESDHLLDTVADVRNMTWLSIGIGLGLLAIFTATLLVVSTRTVNERQRQSERLMAGLLSAKDEERKRIVGALHDDVGQPLYRLLYGLEGCKAELDPGDPVFEELERLEEVVRTIDATLRAELKMLAFGSPDELGLEEALNDVVTTAREETGIDISLDMDGSDRLPVASRSALFKAAQEAITNARRHAAPSSIGIRITSGNHRVILDVEDDGSGVSGPEGLGLTMTRDRLEAIGGGLTVRRRRQGGTVFRAWVPTDNGGPS